MTTKGSFTAVTVFPLGERNPYVVTQRKVLWMDGYDAWLCAFNGVGDSPRLTRKPTSYRFTCYYPNTPDVDVQKTITLSKGHTTGDDWIVKKRTMEYHKGEAGNLIALGYRLTWLNIQESRDCLVHYMENTNESIDLDEKTNDQLLAVCRVEAKKNDCVDCEGCKLKFLCWTHRSIDAKGT